MQREPWYRRAFRREYALLYQHRSDSAALTDVEFALPHLQCDPGALVLDLCCGNGRHSTALAAGGMRVLGLDASSELLEIAHLRVKANNAWYIQGDMRQLPTTAAFAAVTSFFTSFGYFPDPSEDAKVLAEVARVLRPGGRFFFDFLNAEQIRAHLVPTSEREVDGWRIHETRCISSDGLRVEKSVQFRDPNGDDSGYVESVRLYDRAELFRLLQQAELIPIETFGDLSGTRFRSESSPRLVIVSERSEDSNV